MKSRKEGNENEDDDYENEDDYYENEKKMKMKMMMKQ